MYEHTLVLLKPEALQRRLAGKIISMYESKGLKISAMKMIQPSLVYMKKHYDNLKDKPFFNDVIEYTSSNPLIAMIVSGKSAIRIVRDLNGKTNPLDADLASIRGMFGIDIGRNLVHGSENAAFAKSEIEMWFDDFNPSPVPSCDEAMIYE